MNLSEKREKVDKLVDIIKQLPLGTHMTTAYLYKTIFGTVPSDELELIEINKMLIEGAKNEGCFLDLSMHDDKSKALPFHLDFIVKKLGAE